MGAPDRREAASARREEIRSFIEGNDIRRAINRLLDYTRDYSDRASQNRASLISARYYRVRENETKGDRTAADLNAELQRVSESILELADGVFDSYCGATHDQSDTVKFSTDQRTVSSKKVPEVIRPIAEPSTKFERARKDIREKRSVPRQTVLECKNLTKRFKRPVDGFELSGVSIVIRPGDIVGVVGVNGSGKTTLLRIMAGELRPTEGDREYPTLENGCRDWVTIRDQISFVQQAPPSWRGRLMDNLHIHGSLHGLYGQENIDEAEFLIQRLGLHRFRNAKWSEISGGYKMRFELAKALMARPKILILDEPLAPLDIFSQQLLLRDLRDLADSISNPLPIVVTSQHVYEIEAISNTLLFLNRGKPVYCDAPAKIGTARRNNSFELAFPPTSNVSSATLYTALETHNLHDVTVEEHGLQFVLHTPLETSGEDVMRSIAASGHHLQYFRDISCSSRSLFSHDEI